MRLFTFYVLRAGQLFTAQFRRQVDGGHDEWTAVGGKPHEGRSDVVKVYGDEQLRVSSANWRHETRRRMCDSTTFPTSDTYVVKGSEPNTDT